MLSLLAQLGTPVGKNAQGQRRSDFLRGFFYRNISVISKYVWKWAENLRPGENFPGVLEHICMYKITLAVNCIIMIKFARDRHAHIF
jgi:hypothetical protein